MSVTADPRLKRRDLQEHAFSQAGFFTAAQAVEAGYSHQAQKYHVDHGNWLRVGRGLFRLPGWPDAPEDEYVRWSLWSRERAVVSHDTALTLHDLSDANPAKVHLSVPPGFRARHAAVVLHPTTLAPVDIERRAGFAITTVERTLLDVAATPTSQEIVDAAVADAIDRGLTTPRRLRRRAADAPDRAALGIERALSVLQE